jgi:hypothetical protein
MKRRVVLLPIEKLKVHEETGEKRVGELVEKIRKDGVLKNPVVVERRNFVVLDGHHRLAALKRLGMKLIPVQLVNYEDGDLKVYLRRRELLMQVIKEAVIGRAVRGKVFPRKTTRHLIGEKIRNAGVRIEKLKDV